MASLSSTYPRSRFFVWMSLATLLLALAGFAPTYWLPFSTGRSFPPIVHIHSTLFLGWNLLLFWQAWLVAKGRVLDHRQWGLVGISLATAMVISVLLAVQLGYRTAAAIGMEPQARVFSATPLLTLALFVIFFVLAIRNVRQPESHKRYMLGATVLMMHAALARWFMVLLTPPGVVGPPPVNAGVAPAVLANIVFFGALFIHDKRQFGRIHPVSIGIFAAAMTLAALLLVTGQSAIWAGFTYWFSSLANH